MTQVQDRSAIQPLAAATLLSVLWDGIEAGLTIFDSAACRVMANPAAERILGLSTIPAQSGPVDAADSIRVTGRVIYIADGETICPEARLPLHRALAGEIVRNEEFLVCDREHPAGQRLIVNAYPIPMNDGTMGAMVSFHDVTEQRRVERTNTTSMDELSMLIEGAAGYAILQLGPSGEIRSWSRNAEKLLGYTRDDILGRPYSLFFPASDAASGVPDAILATARADGSAQTAGARIRKDGTRFWADGVLTAIREEQGEVVAFVKVLHDVTPRVLAERAVESLARELEELNEGFSYSVSHDLRGPIRAVHGFSRLLRERYEDLLPREGQELVSRIENQAVRMGELVDALLRLSRMQRQPMHRRTVGMSALVRQCWQAVMDDYPLQAVELTIEQLPDVAGDAQLLRQVWMNLLSNAVKYSQRSELPQVRVSSREDGDQLVFEVSDNGAGFDPRYEDKLFKVFQRLHPGEDFSGVGMGLAIVHRIVHRHGGNVWASSVLGEGATFGFSLPRGTDVR